MPVAVRMARTSRSTPSSPLSPTNNADAGEKRWFHGGGIHTWKVSEAESGGTLSVFEDELTQGKMTPLHTHPDRDELSYLIDGEVELNIDGEVRRVGAGSMWMVPRGVPHAFVVLSPTARLLALQTPGHAGRFYWEASEPVVDGSGTVDFEHVKAVAGQTGITDILGPPPFAR